MRDVQKQLQDFVLRMFFFGAIPAGLLGYYFHWSVGISVFLFSWILIAIGFSLEEIAESLRSNRL